jgi:hypothetical protein
MTETILDNYDILIPGEEQDLQQLKLKSEELKLYMKNKTHLECARLCLYYQELERIGNVYFLDVPVDHLSLIDLIKLVYIPKDPECVFEVSELLDMRFSNDKHKNQFREAKKYNRNQNLLKLASSLSIQYKKEYNGQSCPRVKNGKTQKNTSQLLNGKSNCHNCYPSTYIEKVRAFLKEKPLEDWDVVCCGITGFDEVQDESTGEIKHKCIDCDRILKKNSRHNHKKTCKNKK